MIDLQKIKEAVQLGLAFYDDSDPTLTHRAETRDIFIQALAEFEKPVVIDYYDLALRIMAMGNEDYRPAKIADKIEEYNKEAVQQYAESYHQRKCAECGKEDFKAVLSKGGIQLC